MGGTTEINKKQRERGREQQGEERSSAFTLMVVSSEDVISVWPFRVNRQCSTDLVCPSRVARSFPEGTSNTWKEERKTSTRRIQIISKNTESFRLREALTGTVALTLMLAGIGL